jgi:uncharacterized protein YlxW (UPF0749 family)
MIELAITITITVGVLLLAALMVWSSRQSAKERMAMMKMRMDAKQHEEAEDLDEMQREVEAALAAAKEATRKVDAMERVDARVTRLESLARTAGALK